MPNAGDIIFASDFEYLVAQSSSTSSSAAIGTTETVVVTLPSATYLAGCAYRVKVTGGLVMSTTTAPAGWNLRKTSTAGTAVIQWPRSPAVGTTLAVDIGLSERYFVVGASDVTTVLVLSTVATAGATVTHAASAQYPRGVDIHFVGPSSKWPNAVVLS
ncbi:hypothetical protein ACTOB_001399 [Actinoplanes oblitus]|uniref:Uncharacterized protein n=1 Tax=Actinoplanes oblitus TaxID=3040509 RepID=A0ABY8WPZ6_9ACTN|nr:hypothetical protein [Actinoplanes oblitus]WIM97845.1 hypothetical protein ACTOB_001399 [Actinoplanes oblitus]